VASNTTLNTGTGGDIIATKERTHDGDASKVQVVTLAGVSGTEGSYTFGDIGGDATNGLDVDVTRVIPGTSATHLGKAVDSAAGGTDTGVAALFVRDDALTTLTPVDGDYVPGRVDSTGALHVRVSAGGVAGIAEDAASAGGEEGVMVLAVRRDTAAVGSGTDGDFSTLNVNASGRLYTDANVSQMNGVAVTMGNGASGTGVQRVTIANDSTGILAAVTNVATIGTSVTPGTGATHLGKAEDAVHTTGDVGVMAMTVRANTAVALSGADNDYQPLITDTNGRLHVLDANSAAALTALQLIDNACIADDAAFTPASSGVHIAGFFADETATDSVDEGDAGAARMTLDRKQIVTPYAHAAAGGCTPYKNLDVDETEDDIKTSAGKLFWLHAINLTTAVLYLKIYNNVAASVTVGTTVPDLTFPIPTMGDTNGAGFTTAFGPVGMQFSTGICIAATTGLADNNSGAPAANALVVNAGYI
jgi:hypothetical protein